MKKIPKTDSIPFNWIELGKDPRSFFTSRVLKHKEIIDVGFFPGLGTYLLCDPEYIEHVLVKNNKNYKKAKSYEPVKLLLGNGLLTSDGEFWKRQRRIAQPAFHKKVLAGFTDAITEIVEELCLQWEKQLAQGREELNIADEMMKLTVRITSRLLFGADIANKEERIIFLIGELNESTIKMLKIPLMIPLWIPTPNNFKFTKYRKEIYGIVNEIITKRRNIKDTNNEDLLQMLMDARDEETGEGMSDEQLRDEVLTLFLAGSETSSNALSWTLYLFNKQRDKEEIARNEMDTIIDKGLTGLEAMREMRYLSLCMQESMRIYPPAWFISREAIHEDNIDGYVIPKKSQLYISIHGMHNHPEYWGDPENFRPERFEEEHSRPKYAYFPFGGGPRLCIGAELARMEILMTLFKLLERFRFRNSDENVKPEALITLRPKNGLKMKIFGNCLSC
ncbi:MAG: cytochrome P450 [Cytophagaceae bacterium]